MPYDLYNSDYKTFTSCFGESLCIFLLNYAGPGCSSFQEKASVLGFYPMVQACEEYRCHVSTEGCRGNSTDFELHPLTMFLMNLCVY